MHQRWSDIECMKLCALPHKQEAVQVDSLVFMALMKKTNSIAYNHLVNITLFFFLFSNISIFFTFYLKRKLLFFLIEICKNKFIKIMIDLFKLYYFN